MEKNIPIVMSAPTSKEAIMVASQEAIDFVNNGEVSAVETYVRIKALQMYLDNIEKGIKKTFVAEASQYNTKVDRPLGATLKETTTATKFDYSMSEEWCKQKMILDLAKTDLENIQNKMKVTGEATVIGGGDVIYSVTLNR